MQPEFSNPHFYRCGFSFHVVIRTIQALKRHTMNTIPISNLTAVFGQEQVKQRKGKQPPKRKTLRTCQFGFRSPCSGCFRLSCVILGSCPYLVLALCGGKTSKDISEACTLEYPARTFIFPAQCTIDSNTAKREIRGIRVSPVYFLRRMRNSNPIGVSVRRFSNTNKYNNTG